MAIRLVLLERNGWLFLLFEELNTKSALCFFIVPKFYAVVKKEKLTLTGFLEESYLSQGHKFPFWRHLPCSLVIS